MLCQLQVELDVALIHGFDNEARFHKLPQDAAYRFAAMFVRFEEITTDVDFDNDQVEHHVEILECRYHVIYIQVLNNLIFQDKPRMLTIFYHLVYLIIQNYEETNPKLLRFYKQFYLHQMRIPLMLSLAMSKANRQKESGLLLLILLDLLFG